MSFTGLLGKVSAVAIAFGLALAASNAAAAPSVVVSINPLSGLVSALMESVGKPTLLLPGSSSPHGWALKPSQARAIHQADLVVWVGPALEPALARSLSASGKQSSRLSVMAVPGLNLLARRAGETHDHEGHHDHDKDDANSPTDPHLWLDPENAMLIAAAVADRLARIDPENGATYAANKNRLVESLQVLAAQIRGDLAGLQGQKLVVYHDAFQYLERFAGLGQSIVLTEEPDLPRSVGQLNRLARKLDDLALQCLFSEPQFDGRMARVLAQRYDLKPSIIDPLGEEQGPTGYQTMMSGLTRAILSCAPAG